MTTEVVVRVMRPDEWPMARDVGIDAFDGDGLPELLDALRASWSWIDELAFVAEVDGAIAGMVLFNRAILDTDDRNVDVLLLSPLGVRRDLQHRGIGSALMRGALDVLAATRPEPAVFLEGIPTYYPRFGFRRARPLGFTPPSHRIPDEAFMVYTLPSYTPDLRGGVVYPDAFWRVDGVGLRG